MTRDLFDRRLRSLRRDRAASLGPETFLFERAFEECLDRLRDFRRPFARALLVGCPVPSWPSRLEAIAGIISAVDPGACFAARAGGTRVDEDRHDFGEEQYDLCIAIGTLDTVNDLPLALAMIRRALKPDAPLVGAMAGGNSLATLRASLIEAGRARGQVVARTHPRIEASSLVGLLGSAGFDAPVVDIDRLRLRYLAFGELIRDLRSMGATSILAGRGPALSRREAQAVRDAFEGRRVDGRTEETVEILHFVGWRQ